MYTKSGEYMDYFKYIIYDAEIEKKPTVTQAKRLYVLINKEFGSGFKSAKDLNNLPPYLLLYKLKRLCPKISYSQFTMFHMNNIKGVHEQAITLHNSSGTLPKEWFV